tara:strand:+ start:445 stop:747 length:303 start_codon:yes stop_codon:yes gene_type:complete
MTQVQFALFIGGLVTIIVATALRIRVYYKRYLHAKTFMENSVKDMNEKIESYKKQSTQSDSEMEQARQAHYDYFMKERLEAQKQRDRDAEDRGAGTPKVT